MKKKRQARQPTRTKQAAAAKPGKRGPRVGVVMGSDTDLPVMSETIKFLQDFGLPFEVEITSAHRSPARTQEYARTAIERGLQVIIVGAGGASHLAGIIAAETTLPVIAVPVVTTPLGGLDALYSTVQMPAGIPVGVMAVDKPGARNAAIYAAEIIALADAQIARRLRQHKEDLARSVAEKSARVKEQFQQ